MDAFKRGLLQILAKSGGVMTTHPFVESANKPALEEFREAGLVEMFLREDRIPMVKLTQKGYDFLAAPSA